MSDRVTQHVTPVELLNGKTYFVRRLSLLRYKGISGQLAQFEGLDETKPLDKDTIDALIEVCFQILKPSNFWLTRRGLGDIVDGETAMAVINAAMPRRGAKDEKQDTA